MASFKRLKRSDVISVPYVANKNWVFEYCPYPTDQNIRVFKGTNITGSFSLELDAVTEGQYERLIYNQINHLFYQKYSSSVENLNTSSLISSLYYDGASQIRATASYFDYNDNPGLVKNFPTGAMEGIRVLSIDQSLYGEQILPYAFELSSSAYYIKDDGIGNLIDYLHSNTHVGNIFYSHGLAVITNQDYQLLFPLPPLAQYKEVTFFDTDTYRYVSLTGSVDTRGGTLLTSSLSLFNLDYVLFNKNTSGSAYLTNIAGVGSYYTNYSFSASLSGSTCGTNLESNAGLLKVNIKNNCAFTITATENPFPSPSVTPTPTVTVTPSVSPSIAASPSASITPSVSTTPNLSVTPTPTRTPSITVSPSITPTITPSISTTPSISITPSPSQTSLRYTITIQNVYDPSNTGYTELYQDTLGNGIFNLVTTVADEVLYTNTLGAGDRFYCVAYHTARSTTNQRGQIATQDNGTDLYGIQSTTSGTLPKSVQSTTTTGATTHTYAVTVTFGNQI